MSSVAAATTTIQPRGRRGLVAVTAVAVTIGVAPIVCVVGKPYILAAVFAGAAVLATVFVATSRSESTARPTVADFLLATVDGISPTAILSGLFFAVYGGVALLVGLLSLAGPNWNERSVALPIGVIFSAVLLPTMTFLTLHAVRDKLYPRVAGIPSRYHRFASTHRGGVAVTVAFGVLAPAGGIGYLLAANVSSLGWAGLLAAYTIVISVAAAPPAEPSEAGHAGANVIRRLERAFESVGYSVVQQPRTGKSEVDPLLVDLDLFAQKGERGLVIDIKDSGDGTNRASWTDGTRLATAARILEFDLPRLSSAASSAAAATRAVATVHPVLVLVNVEADESLLDFARAEHVAILGIGPGDRNISAFNVDADDDLRKVAQQFAELRPERATPGAAEAQAVAG